MPKLNSVSPPIYFYILSILILCLPFCARCQDSAQEQEILLKLKQFWHNPPSIGHWIGSSYNSTAHCSWPEVACSNNLITGLEFHFPDINGTLPSFMSGLKKLKTFDMQGQNLIGEIPDWIGNFQSLESLRLSLNHLAGSIPSGLFLLKNLTTLDLSGNNLTGEIPRLVESLKLNVINLSYNSLTGSIPDDFGKLENLTRLLLAFNQLSGEIPSTVSSWKNVQMFKVSNNLLNGTIPMELTHLPQLQSLYLDNNQLSGPIPAELGYLPALTYLDLSSNQLSGPIPSELGLLKLDFLDLSSNHLTGSIPSKFEIAAYSKSFLDNSGLCTANASVSLARCNLKSPKENLVWIVILTVATSVLTVSALSCALVAININGKKRHALDSTWKLTPFQKLNFTESNILPGLTDCNLVGSGGSGKVYRVAVNHLGDLVAVKLICNSRKLDEKIEKQFLAEAEILGNIRHMNIVKLLCCISSENSKLLVYEYMENSSLDRWLHRKKKRSSLFDTTNDALKWPQRLQIAIGAARGLCYMHHDCSPPIIHRDLKSSNILLDSEFNAKIADFGLARILLKQGQADTMTTVAGSFGYIAPEYARTTRVNEKVDVYSFGVILLEVATGREANDGDEDTCLAEWAWQHMLENTPIVNALDEEIKEPGCLQEMIQLFKLGVVCTSPLPSARPSMKDVLRILQKYGPSFIRVEEPAETDRVAAVAPLLINSRCYAEIGSGDCSLSSNSP